ncbi:MAG: hypothetical protein P8X65_15330, partial [Syntrophobacterales bacterium]
MKPVRTANPGSEIQDFYARFLDRIAKSVFLMIIFLFGLYVSGVLSPFVPFDCLSQYWSQPLSEYLHTADVPTGWSWLAYLYYGDFLTFLPIAGLAGITILGYLYLAPKFYKHNELILGSIAILEIIILLLAASGIL